MSDDVLVAVDAGTSRVKAVAFAPDGTELETATRATETLRPAPGEVEQEMTTVWEATAAALREVTGALPDGADPVGVGVTGQGDGLWAITADGEPARNAVLWSDSRAAPVLEEWEASGTLAAIIEQCGSAPYPGMSLPLMAWFARERPDEFERIDTVLSCKDWLKYRLTGERTLDHSEATVPYLDRAAEYEPAVFDRVGLPGAKGVLPRLAAPTEVVGHVTGAAADATGLEAGLPVVSGSFDVPASALGSGAAAAGDAAVTLGTSLTHQVFVDGPQPDSSGIQMALGLGELWTYAIGSNAGTPSLEWAADTLAGERPVGALAELAEPVPVGSEGVVYHPYLSSTGERGPFVDPDARGQFVGLTTDHDSAHLVRAVYEGLSLAVRDCIEHLPVTISEVRLSGGGSRSPFWCQLIADCLGQPTAVPAGSEVGAKGAAILLALGLEVYPSLGAAVDEMVSIERRYTPREPVAEQYDDLYGLFVDLRSGMAPLWSERAETYRGLHGTADGGES